MGKIHEALKKSQRNEANKTQEPLGSDLKPMQYDDRQDDRQTDTEPRPLRLAQPSSHFDQDLIAYFKPESLEAEQFRKLAASIIFQDAENSGRCILITSTIQGEGKSFLSANLAVSLAKSLEEPVLLMDCDLRKPRLHKIFGVSNAIGLSDHFMKRVELSRLIQETAIDNLTILPAGGESFHSAELLSSKRMTAVLEEVKRLYKDKVILIDSPPPLSTTEPVAIAKRADKVILVVKCGAAPKERIEDVISAIGKEKIFGVVLNQSNQRLKKYYRYSAN